MNLQRGDSGTVVVVRQLYLSEGQSSMCAKRVLWCEEEGNVRGCDVPSSCYMKLLTPYFYACYIVLNLIWRLHFFVDTGASEL